MMTKHNSLLICIFLTVTACTQKQPDLQGSDADVLVLSRSEYANQLEGFWLGQSIANWTGLVTEMDKIGGEGPAGEFYTRDDWGQPDQPNVFSGRRSPWS